MSDEEVDLIRHRLARARQSLEEARLMAETGHWNGCINRLYYACFYAASALLIHRGISVTKHTAVRASLNRDFVKPGVLPIEMGAFYNNLFETRHESDYEDFYQPEPETVRTWLPEAERFIGAVEDLIMPA